MVTIFFIDKKEPILAVKTDTYSLCLTETINQTYFLNKDIILIPARN
jgi:hypothetical protein